MAQGSELARGTLAELGLQERGIVVLGIDRAGGAFEGVPSGEARLAPGDTAILYGRAEALEAVTRSRA